MTIADSAHRERYFEEHIFDYLTAEAPLSDRWLAGNAAGYDRERAIYPEDVIGWLRDTQHAAWGKLETLNGANTERRVLDTLVKKLKNSGTGGTLEVLRRGFSLAGGGTLKMSQSWPEDDRNERLIAMYAAHRFRVVRQLKYNPTREWSIDLVFFVNGIPVATWELKSDFTQNLEAAVNQYKFDRSPKAPNGGIEPLLSFRRGALVHFAVSTTEARMCTHLQGENSHFLPFNQGHNGAAGNPPQPPESGRYPVAYLWEETFQRDNLLKLIHRFFIFESMRKEDANGRRYKQETMFFPRYHQWQAVSLLDAAVRREGVGRRYLLEHSAGSGKTNTIAWLCHDLIRMHDADGARKFASVIVVTDRTLLDDQLREAIKQIDHQDGVVEGIERKKGDNAAKSAKLARALLNGVPIVVVTIQTFPFAVEAILENRSLRDSNFAVVIDEAHNSQTGQAASKLRAVLTLNDEDELETLSPTEIMARLQEAREFPANVSYFAFTATPKHATLTLFGRPDADGKPRSFHCYSMRQAIEEGFILDVLQGYMPYRVARRLSEVVDHDKRVDARQAARALARWTALHPTNVAQKVEFIIEHFRRNLARLLNGQAKAMVVTSSRAQAVVFKRALDAYILHKGYPDLHALVAFSGKVSGSADPIPLHYPALAGEEFSESSMNDIRGDLRDAFDSDDYQLLIVANKFQTGFDQPKLCAMYLDKRVSGVEAVQTLSRLNRTAPGKSAETTYIIDFANEPEEIVSAFRTYYDAAEVSEPQNLDVVYELKDQLDQSLLYTRAEVNQIAEILTTELHATEASARLINAVQPAVERFNGRLKGLNETIRRWEQVADRRELEGDSRGVDEAESQRSDYAAERDKLMKLRDGMRKFIRLYEFIAQVVPLGDPELEKLSRFIRLYVKRLANVPTSEIDLAGLQMTHFGLYKRGEIDTTLRVGEQPALRPVAGGISPGRDRTREKISEIIHALNELFGEGLSEGDKIKRAANLLATSEHARRNRTVRKQIDAGNSEEQMMQGGDLEKAVTSAVLEMLANSRDKEDATRLLKDRRAMASYARLVYKVMNSDLSKEDLLGLS